MFFVNGTAPCSNDPSRSPAWGVSGDLLSHAISYSLVSSIVVIFQAGGRASLDGQQIKEGGRKWREWEHDK